MRTVVTEFESQAVGALVSYGDTGCKLDLFNQCALALTHERYSNQLQESVYIFAKRPELGAQVFLDIFPMPQAATEATQELAFYHNQRANFRLPAGQRFSEDFLAPSAVGFHSHEAFLTRDGRTRRRVVHHFVGAHRAILLVYSRDDAAFLASPFVTAVQSGLSLHDLPLEEPFLRTTTS